MGKNMILAAAAATALLASVSAQPQKRVAVLNFEYGTVQSSVSAIFGTNTDVGKGIADMLVDRLVNGHVYSVIERKALDKVLAEQNFSNSDRADASTAAKLGKVLGVDAIVIGSITQFGRDDKSQSVGGRAFGGITSRYGIGGVGRKESKAVVQITARLINVDTAQVLASVSGHGESQRSGVNLLGAGGSINGGGGGSYDMGSSNFNNTIIGEATNQAITELAQKLQADSSFMPTHAVKLNGLVADVSGDTIVLNIGSKAGVRKGDHLKVVRPVREIRDPASGKVIRRIENNLGELVITDVDDLSALGKFSGSTPPKIGDAVSN